MAEGNLIDPTLCTNPENPGETCGGFFEHKTSPGLCAFCYLLVNDAARAEALKDWPQCQGCSAQFRNLKGPRCGSCVKKDAPATLEHSPRPPLAPQDENVDQSAKSVQQLQAENRRNAMAARMLLKAPSKTPGNASLQVAAAKGTSRQITVYLVPMSSNGARTEAAKILVNASRGFPEDTPMSDVMTLLLRHWNLEWEKECSESLLEEHVSLRLINNLGVQPHSMLGTLGNFYDTHDRVYGMHPKKILQGPPTLKIPMPGIYLEGLIMVQEFEKATKVAAPYFVHTDKENQKRSSSQTTLGSEFAVSKRLRSKPNLCIASLRSEFAAVPGFSKVSFIFAGITVGDDGVVTIAWPEVQDGAGIKAASSTCLLQDAPFDHGKTKQVYKVILDGFPWVAKRFYDVGIGEEQVGIQDNHDEVVKEATRLSQVGYFLARFVAEAKKQGVDIEPGLRVTDFKIGFEVFATKQWLFEPRRNSKVFYWSGTNDHPAWPKSKIGSTLNAFVHFTYIFSQESTVLADLQTAAAVDENGEPVHVLFDIMTHTIDGSSGVGDHGETGISTFLAQHACVNRCKNLGLSRDGFDTEDEGSQDGEEED
ncbi:kinase-like domain-containing protein [Mycena galericulata]|nr:kinase-like domain-containing protein [Mycena galericulata]